MDGTDVAIGESRVLTTGEVAKKLGVTPQRVRKMISKGRLAASRSSGGWLITASGIADRVARRGRPVHPRTVWSAVALLDAALAHQASRIPRGLDLVRIVPDRRLRYHIVQLLTGMPDPVDDIASWQRFLASRGSLRRMWSHPGVIPHLMLDSRISQGGVAAGNFGLSVNRSRVEIYVNQSELKEVIADFRLKEAEDGAIFLRIVPLSVPPILKPHGGKKVGLAAAAADLLDEGDPRSVAAGQRQLRILHQALLCSIDKS